jgi:hypothetical protein
VRSHTNKNIAQNLGVIDGRDNGILLVTGATPANIIAIDCNPLDIALRR